MSRRVSISMRAARALAFWEGYGGAITFGPAEQMALAELRRAIEPGRPGAYRRSPESTEKRRAHMRKLHALRRESRASIWEACWKRCDDQIEGCHICECGCGRPVLRDPTNLDAKAELEHPFSKGKGARLPQSVETCWILRADCHRDRHAARPDAAVWWKKFIVHMESIGDAGRVSNLAAGATWYVAITEARKRLRFVEVRASLPAAPRTRHVRD